MTLPTSACTARLPLLSILILLLSASGLLGAVETSRVLRLSIPGLLDDRHDVELVLYQRAGTFHYGYALVPDLDNLPHLIDLLPTRPVEWRTDTGEVWEPPAQLRGNYSFRDDDFARYRQMYEEGRIRIVHPIDLPRLGQDGERISGVLDLQISRLDASRGGRNPPGRCFRLIVDLALTTLGGTVTAWEYAMDRQDDSYGHHDAPRRTLAVTARWDEDHWQPVPGSELAAGSDWPQAWGPALRNVAADSATPLVRNLHDARLLWVAEDLLPGNSGTTRGDFSMRTFSWTGHGNDVFGSPAVADGRVFLYTYQPTVEHLVEAAVADENNAFYRLGIKPAALTAGAVDVVTAWDARTGRRLWRHVGRTGGSPLAGKGTNGVTPCVVGDLVIVRGSAGVMALDVASGEQRWFYARSDRVDLSLNNTDGSSSEASPVLIDGVLVLPVGRQGDLIGLDPHDGSRRWLAERVIAHNQIPQPVTIDGVVHLLTTGPVARRSTTGSAHLLRAATGERVWTSDLIGPTVGPIMVIDDILFANGAASGNARDHRVAAFRITASGLEPLWVAEGAHWMGGRQIPVGHRGVLYTDSRQTGFGAFAAVSGAEVGRNGLIPSLTQGSHNWSWTLASNDRIFTSGVLMFSTHHEGFRLLPGRLSVDERGGYVCPTRPAIADGRLFLRTETGLVCYDLREQRSVPPTVVELTAAGATLHGQDLGIRLRLPAEGSGRASLGVRLPPHRTPDANRINNWVAHVARTLDWRGSPLVDYRLSDQVLECEQSVMVGWHREHWRLQAQRDGDAIHGTLTRSVSAIETPTPVSGSLHAFQHHDLGADRRLYQVGLSGGIHRPGSDPVDV